MEQTVYKVVRDMNGHLTSSTNHPHQCFYEIGKKTIPEIGGIFVFKSLKDAQNYVSEPDLKILSGIGYNVIGLRKMCAWGPDFYRFWKLKSLRKSTNHLSCKTVKNTCICDWFIPLEKIC